MRSEAAAELTREIADAGRGVARLARYDPDWAAPLDLSATGFLRSFFAPAFALPFYLVWAGMVSAASPQGGEPTLKGVVAASLAHVIGSLGYPLLVAAFARPLGVTGGYGAFIVVVNWATLFLNIALALLAVVVLAGEPGLAIFSLCWLTVFALSMFITWRAARETLSTEVAPAVLMVVLMVGFSVAADQLGEWLVRTFWG